MLIGKHPPERIFGLAVRLPFCFRFRIVLHFSGTGVIHVVTAVITAKRRNIMTSSIEVTETAPAPAAKEPKLGKKGTAGARRAHVTPGKGNSRKDASPAKKAPKTAPRPNVARSRKAAKEKGARDGSKTAQILELLKRPGGVTSKELMKATGWQPHSVRGFLSGTVGKKMGLAVTSIKGEDRERSYFVKA